MPEELIVDDLVNNGELKWVCISSAIERAKAEAYREGYASASRKVREYLGVLKSAVKDSDTEFQKIVSEACISTVEDLLIILATEGAKL